MKKLVTIIIFLFIEHLSADAQRRLHDTIYTDSSIIVTSHLDKSFWKYGNEVNETVKKNGNRYYTVYFRNNKTVQSHTSIINNIMYERIYNSKGKIFEVIDCNKGTWTIYDTVKYPYFNLINDMKHKADSLICAVYGQVFFKKYVIWSPMGSYMYGKQSGSYEDVPASKPTSFLFRYSIILDKEHREENMIEFELDSLGKFLSNNEWEYKYGIFGFEKKPAGCDTFKLTCENAIQLANKNGVSNDDETKPFCMLHWESFKTNNFYNGAYKLYVTQCTAIDKTGNDKSHTITKHYLVTIFDPWTGVLENIEKKKVVSNYEELGGYTSPMEDDN